MYRNPLHVERVEDPLSGLDHPVVFCRHTMTSFDIGSLITVVTANELYLVPRDCSEPEQTCHNVGVNSSLRMRTVPSSLLTLFKQSAAEL